MLISIIKIVLGVVIIILLAILVGNILTQRQINEDVEALFANGYEEKYYSKEQIKNLPEPVQRYFENVLTDGQKYIDYVRLKHDGKFRMDREQGWSEIRGEEYFLGREPGFVWVGKVPSITGVDKFVNYKGSLQIRLFSTIKVVDESGPEIDQGEFLRWLGEATMYPTALLPSQNLQWEEIDESSARVNYQKGDIKVEVVFVFNDKGEAVSFKAKRYFQGKLEDWTGSYDKYIEVDNVKVPSKVEVEWNFEDGDFSYAKFYIEEIEFDKPTRY